MPDDISEQLTILSLVWSCLWSLSDDTFLYHLSQSEYAIHIFFVFEFCHSFLCLLLLFTAKCKLIDIF